MSSPSISFRGCARFVILEHDWPFLHWDFLLESGNLLRAWRLLQPVTLGQWIEAQPLPDHRLVYLEYEGPVSGNRGEVRRVGAGRFTAEAGTDDADLRLCLQDYDAANQATLRIRPPGNSEWLFS